MGTQRLNTSHLFGLLFNFNQIIRPMINLLSSATRRGNYECHEHRVVLDGLYRVIESDSCFLQDGYNNVTPPSCRIACTTKKHLVPHYSTHTWQDTGRRHSVWSILCNKRLHTRGLFLYWIWIDQYPPVQWYSMYNQIQLNRQCMYVHTMDIISAGSDDRGTYYQCHVWLIKPTNRPVCLHLWHEWLMSRESNFSNWLHNCIKALRPDGNNNTCLINDPVHVELATFYIPITFP